MERRHVLKGLAAGAVGLGLSASTGPVWSTAMAATASRSRARDCKIIGIGGAGCNILVGLASGVDSGSSDLSAEYICVDLGSETLPRVDASTGALLDYSPIRCLSLAEFGAGGSVNAARVAALRKRDQLRILVAGADLVFLVAALGGGTGSGVTPILARLAREAGALTVATVITPFAFEGQRNRTARTALSYLKGDADLVVEFSNEKWAYKNGDDTTLDELFTSLDRQVEACIRGLMEKGPAPLLTGTRHSMTMDLPCNN